MLHAEEGLWLVERGLLAVQHPPYPPSPSSTFTAAAATTASRGPPTPSAASNTGKTSGSGGFLKAGARLEVAGSPARGGHAGTDGTISDGSLEGECAQDVRKQSRSRLHSGAIISGVGGPVKPVESGSSFVSTGLVRETLSRARVPWECYRAYAELKRRCVGWNLVLLLLLLLLFLQLLFTSQETGTYLDKTRCMSTHCGCGTGSAVRDPGSIGDLPCLRFAISRETRTILLSVLFDSVVD